MRTLLSSPRRRRRLAWGTLAVAALGAVALLIAFVRNTAGLHETFQPGQPQIYKEPDAVKLTTAELREVHATAVRFMESAVARRRLEQSYRLTTPALRQGMSLAEWKTGNIPAQPYPVDTPSAAKWRVAYSYRDDVMLAFAVLPTHQAEAQGIRPMAFSMELKRLGTGAARKWLVDAWVPLGGGSPQLAPDDGGPSARPPAAVEAPLSATWLALPIGILASIILVPIGIGLASWYRGRAEIRKYEASL